MLLLKPAVGSGEEVRFDSVVGSISTESSVSTCTVQFNSRLHLLRALNLTRNKMATPSRNRRVDIPQQRSSVKSRVTAGGSNPVLPPTLGGILATGQLGKHFNKTKKSHFSTTRLCTCWDEGRVWAHTGIYTYCF